MQCNKKSFIFFTVFICVSAICNAEIISLDNIKEVEKVYNQEIVNFGGEHILGLWDIDMTILETQDPTFHLSNILKHHNVYKNMRGDFTNEQIKIAETWAIMKGPSQLVETDFLETFTKLKNNDIKMIALTAVLTGKLENIERIENSRYQTLQDLNIDFSYSFTNLTDVRFDSLNMCRGNYPIYYKGILFSNECGGKINKGNVLVEFMKKTSFLPKVIIFADDNIKYLKAVEEVLLDKFPSIKFIGIRYTGAFKPKKTVSEQAFQIALKDIFKVAR